MDWQIPADLEWRDEASHGRCNHAADTEGQLGLSEAGVGFSIGCRWPDCSEERSAASPWNRTNCRRRLHIPSLTVLRLVMDPADVLLFTAVAGECSALALRAGVSGTDGLKHLRP